MKWKRMPFAGVALVLLISAFSLSSSDSFSEQTDSAIAEAGPDQTILEGDVAQFNGTLSSGSFGVTVFRKNIKVNDENPLSYDVRREPRIEIDDFGVIHAIWSEYTGNPYEYLIHYSRSADGGLTFQPDIVASNVTKAVGSGIELTFPQLAVGSDGTIHVIWTNFQAGDFHPMVYYTRSLDNGSSFDSPRLISQQNISNSIEVSFVGHVHILLSSIDEDMYYLKSIDNGGSFGEFQRMNDIEGKAVGGVMIVDKLGDIHVGYGDIRDYDLYGYDVYYSKSTDDGQTFSEGIRINDDTGKSDQGPQNLVVDSKGNIYVFFEDWRFSPNKSVMYSVSVDKGLSFGENKLLLQANLHEFVYLWYSNIAIGFDDVIRVVWDESFRTPHDGNIWYAEMDVGKELDLRRVLVTDDLRNNTRSRVPAIDIDFEDNTHVLWLDNRDMKDKALHSVYYARSEKGRAEITTYEWDMNNLMDSNGDGNLTNDVDATGPTPTYAYGDDGVYPVTLKVTDEVGATAYDTTNVTVLNVDPVISDVSYSMEKANASISFRIAGEKWHNVEVYLYEDSTEIGYANITRFPGSPNDQMVTLANMVTDSHKLCSAVAYYTPEDDPASGEIWGATPAWFIIEFEGGERRVHHTFNVKHEETWIWNIQNMNQYFPIVVAFKAQAFDPGSDDLKFMWDFGDGTSASAVYYNNGVGPDPYPSPNVNPVEVTDVRRHTFMSGGTYTVMLGVEDDDGGNITYSFDLTL